MGDHRLSVDMTLVGANGEEVKQSMWVNWHEDRPADVYKMIISLAEEAQMNVNDRSFALEEY